MGRRVRDKILFLLVVLAAATRFASVVQAQTASLPDLTVSDAVLTADPSGHFVQRITVTVKNTCRAAAVSSYVLVTFKVSSARDAKPIYFTGGPIRALRSGDTWTHIFDLSDRKIAYGSFVFIEADPYKKVAEVDEDNNWRTLFPSGAGAPRTGTQCTQNN